MAERDFSEIARLSERFNKDPTSRIFVQLADAYRKNKMIDEAIEVINQGLEHHPDYPLAHLIRGKCLFDSRNYNQAKESFEQTISLDPQNVVAYRMLAQTCAFLKDNAGLISAYKGILALDPYDAAVKEKLADLVDEKQEPMYTVSMAQEYEQQGDMKKALEIYEHLLYTDPSDLLLQQKVKALRGSLVDETAKPSSEPTYTTEDITRESDIPPSEMEKHEPPEEKSSDVVTHEPSYQQEAISLEDILSGKSKEPIAQEPRTKESENQEPRDQKPIVQEARSQEPEDQEPLIPDQEQLSAEAIDSEEILKLIETRHDEEPVLEPHAPEETEDIIIERTSAGEPSLAETPQEREKADIPEPVHELPSEPPLEETLPEESEMTIDVSTPSEEPPVSQESPPEPSQKPGKPKEEDFQSFKDWLSGLLK
jgi:tetratricopeptide (TPR) repeat protein